MAKNTQNRVTIDINTVDHSMSVSIFGLPTAALSPSPAPKGFIPQIGEEWPGEGGVYAGVIRDGNNQWHLIVPTKKKATAKLAWGGPGSDSKDAISRSDGQANTKALAHETESHPAAEFAAGLNIDGHTDFYLPAQKELSLMFANLQDFFEPEWHWSSTQYSAHTAWITYFENGYQSTYGKDGPYAVRAVRRLPI